jgi:hypothetical protein
MMINPKDEKVVLSPSPGGSGVNTCVARFNYTREISYDAGLQGQFSIIATPTVKDPLIIQSANPRYPPAGSASISMSAIGFAFDESEPVVGCPSAGWMVCEDVNTYEKVALLPRTIIGGRPAWGIVFTGGQNLRYNVATKGHETKFVIFSRYEAGVWIDTGAIRLDPGGATSTTVALVADVTAITFMYCTVGGALKNPVGNLDNFLMGATGNGYVPPAISAQTVGAFVRDELAAEGQVENVRVTAMSLLVSPVGQWANIGGRMVMARTLASNLVKDANANQLMDTITKLNDPHRPWIDTPLQKGAYSWWMPDDASSYAQHGYNVPAAGSENVLVCAGRMEAGNTIRVVATYVVEFLSPKQVFTKDIGPPLDGLFLQAYNQLLLCPAVSENEEHGKLISGIRSALSAMLGGIKWVGKNGPTLLAAGEAIGSLL